MSIREQFKQTEKLYHFTSFDTGKLILESKCLRFGRLSNMNDIHESSKMVFADGGRHMDRFPSDILEAFYEEIYKHRQISLTTDSDDKDGFDLHQMWGLYADKGEGVCLVFDKSNLLRLADMQDVHHDRVSYDDSKKLESFCVSHSDTLNEISSEVETRISEIFFHKRAEWEHEQEYRLIKRCSNPNREEYLRYGDSLKFIITSSKLYNVDEIKYNKQIDELNKFGISLLVYGNGFLDYSLDAFDGEETVWKAENGYDILVLDENCKLAI